MTTKEEFDKMTDEQKFAALNAAEKDVETVRSLNKYYGEVNVHMKSQIDIIKNVLTL